MKRRHWHDLLWINLFWLGLNIRNNAVGSMFTPFLIDKFAQSELRNTTLGAIRTAGLIIAMLVQPAAGLLSDRSTARLGRRRPFILVGVLLDLVFLAAIALSFNVWSLLVATLLIQFSANISHGALQGLIPDLVPEEQRGTASAIKSILELVPLILLGFTIAPLIEAGHFPWAVATTGLLLLVTMLLTLLLVHEKPLDRKPDTPLKPAMVRVLGMLAGIGIGALGGLVAGGVLGGLSGLVAWAVAGLATARTVAVGIGGIVAMPVAVVVGVWAGALTTVGKSVRERPSFVWWMVNRLMFMAAVTSIQTFAPFFLMYAFDVNREIAAGMTGGLMTVVGIFTLLSALPGGWLADRIDPRRIAGISGIIAAVGTAILLASIWAPTQALIYVAGCTLGLAAGMFMTANWALGTRIVPPKQAGRYLGISNLAGAGAGMIGSGIGGPVADYLNHTRPGLGYFALFAGYGVLFVLSVVVLGAMRRSHVLKHQEV